VHEMPGLVNALQHRLLAQLPAEYTRKPIC
jgi:hypothetical protein